MSDIKSSPNIINTAVGTLSHESQNNAQIDLLDSDSVNKWKEVLGLSSRDLFNAVQDFGPNIKDIRRGLINQKSEDADQNKLKTG